MKTVFEKTLWNHQLLRKIFHVILYLIVYIRFIQAAYFDKCNAKIPIKEGYSYLESPYFPRSYPPNSSCRYEITAPLDFEIYINCTLYMDNEENRCTTESFYVARDGDLLLRDSEKFCGQGNFVRKSLFRRIVLAYISHGSWGRFRCQLLATPQTCDCGWSISTRIVNGQEAKINEYPNTVALKDITQTTLESFCAGSIISHRFVLTAAHCTLVQPQASNILILAGDHNLRRSNETKYSAQYYVKNIFNHPNYVEGSEHNDIALLQTIINIEWSRGVGPICLPPYANRETQFSYNYADVVGWGTLSFGGPRPDTLQKVTLLIIDNQTCQRIYNGIVHINSTQICTADSSGQHRDSCQYDSGGPVILRRSRQFLLGLVSLGQACGIDDYAVGINTRVTSYLGWIYQFTGSTICTVNI